MAQSDYYGDQPAFQRKDLLMRWTLGLFIAAVVATTWVLLVLFLLATEAVGNGTDTAFGVDESTWSTLAAILMVATLIGLVFVVVARLGGTAGGAYLAADLREEQARRAVETESTTQAEAPTAEVRPAMTEHRKALLRGARVEDPFGPDGRMVLSYTHPDTARSGVFGDAYVAVDTDSVLNVRTLLHAAKQK